MPRGKPNPKPAPPELSLDEKIMKLEGDIEHAASHLVERIKEKCQRGRAHTEKLSHEFLEDPLKTVEWLQGSVKEIQIAEWYGRILDLVHGSKETPSMTYREAITHLKEHLTEDLLENRYHANSTSPFHNAVEEERAKAASEMLNEIKWLEAELRYIDEYKHELAIQHAIREESNGGPS